MLDYDREATRYDATRGGEPRADAAAAAYAALLADAPAGPVLDLGCGTGLVTRALARATGRTVLGLDASAGMLGLAAARLPGRVLRGDGARLPARDGSLAAVTAVWLLHLLPAPTVAAVVAEAARVLAPGGLLVTTVDKNGRGDGTDAEPVLTGLAAESGLRPHTGTRFVGVGQAALPGRRPADPVYRVQAFRA
ncbi:ubiquinone/menaquinone biosynthesis C-methylase UbiE [Friedmanniella endophytica]|uniref:Ubiquinone/menaquinone biosynthesis C-methylase UbiE n=1 Tax=Microlunatus kandeliicorticis TaxID=1759536 RepID=A0A7W3P6S4_9ACTN|nr:class I SAM-dependent methyltransferase [Microlunatus kandeliicorticis]MBA8795252.1 ubiquinone/menaquinone biosynthesis C-methylase UbiE [Microlunatus kandeliicorticis]